MLAKDLIQQLEQYLQQKEQQLGRRLEVVVIGRPEWEAMGCPNMVRGTRIEPSSCPQVTLDPGLEVS